MAEQQPEAPGVTRWRQKPVVIEAMQLTPLSIDEAEAFVGGDAGICPEHAKSACLVIATLEGPMHASMRDWIIKGVKGEFCPCKPDIFAATYEPAGEPLTLPADEFAAVKTVAEHMGVTSLSPASPGAIAAASETVTWTPEDIREFEARFREAMEKGSYTILLSEPRRERAEAAEAKLAEVRETIATFLAHYGHSELPSFKVALDLAHGIQQVLDRKGPDDA